jgi:hypothetical protein
MATRMQQRTGTQIQWSTSNPILNGAEIGYESDTNKFKIGDGNNHWNDLPYFLDEESLGSSLDGYIPESLLGAANGVAQLNSSGKLVSDQIPNVDEITQDAINTALVAGDGITKTYDDNGNTITIDVDITSGDGLKVESNKLTVDGLVVQKRVANVSDEEIGYLNGVTAPIQTQLNNTVLSSAIGYSVASLDNNRKLPIAELTANVAFMADVSAAQSAAESNSESYADTEIAAHNSDSTSVHGIDNTADLLTDSNTKTVTNKSVSLATNTITGTIAQFNTAVSDADLATLAGTETLTNKTISAADNTITINASDIVDVTATAGEINTLSGLTASTAELNILDGVTSTASELNILDGATLTVTELNYVDGVTSSIQTQIDDKLSKTGGTMTGALTLSGAPTSDLHAATKLYVDNVTAGINFHQSVHVGTTANLSADYNNGTNGIGATLTASENAAWPTIDGHTSFTQYDRILVKNQTDAKQNGIYVLSDLGGASSKWILTRATDADNNPTGEMKKGDFVLVINGTVNASVGYINNSATDPIVIGTDNISYTEFSAGKTVVAGNGLSEATAGTLSINTSITADLSTAQTLTNKTLTSPKINEDVALVATATELNYVDGVTSSIQTQLNAKENSKYAFVTESGTSRTLVASTDVTNTINFTSSSAITLTVPNDSADGANWAVGTFVDIFQYGAGQITVTPASGVTIRSTDSQLKSRVRYSTMTLIKLANNEWLLVGDTAA